MKKHEASSSYDIQELTILLGGMNNCHTNLYYYKDYYSIKELAIYPSGREIARSSTKEEPSLMKEVSGVRFQAEKIVFITLEHSAMDTRKQVISNGK